jgi:3-hydroxyisobutyrate dehydrogenase
MRIAVLGTGIMGGPMARNLAAAGHDVSAWNRTPEKAGGLGCTVADTPAEAVEGAEIVLTMLADGPTVDAVVPELDPGVLWIQSSTVGVADTERFAARHARFLDAPVLGSRPAAEAGELLVLAAGADRPEEILAAISNRVMWLADEAGRRTKLKLTINLWILNLVENLRRDHGAGRRSGLDQRSFLDAIKAGRWTRPTRGSRARRSSPATLAGVRPETGGEGRGARSRDGRVCRRRPGPGTADPGADDARDRTRSR